VESRNDQNSSDGESILKTGDQECQSNLKIRKQRSWKTRPSWMPQKEKKIDRVAEKAAEKSTKAVQQYDKTIVASFRSNWRRGTSCPTNRQGTNR